MPELGEIAEFIGKHKEAFMLGAGMLAFKGHHPMRAMNESLSYAATGDKQNLHRFERMGSQVGLSSALGGIGIGASPSFLQPGLSSIAHENIDSYYSGPNPNQDEALYHAEMNNYNGSPSGNQVFAANNVQGGLVFGLYNNRLR